MAQKKSRTRRLFNRDAPKRRVERDGSIKSSVQSSALSNDFQASVSMVMAVSSNEKEIANMMLKSVVYIGSPLGMPALSQTCHKFIEPRLLTGRVTHSSFNFLQPVKKPVHLPHVIRWRTTWAGVCAAAARLRAAGF